MENISETIIDNMSVEKKEWLTPEIHSMDVKLNTKTGSFPDSIEDGFLTNLS